jgi:hypothetical protein
MSHLHQPAPEALPPDVATLVARVQNTRAELDRLIMLLSPREMTDWAPGGGWSVKDHLAHLGHWERKLLAVLRGQPAHEGLGLDAETYAAAELDTINAILASHDLGRTLNEVTASFWRTHEELVAALQALTDADLQRPYQPADPDDARRLVEGIADNSYRHDREHIGWIRAMLALREGDSDEY